MGFFKITKDGYLDLERSQGQKQRSPLIRLVIDEKEVRPSSVTVKGDIYHFLFGDHWVDIQKVDHEDYTTFEAIGMGNIPEKDVEVLLWGPIEIPLTEVVGESVGVVQGNDKAFGLHVLNPKTLGGWPKEYEALGYAHEEKGSDTRYDYTKCVAWPLKNTSILQAYTRDWSKNRVRMVMDLNIPQDVCKLTGDKASIIGSKIALFYCDRKDVMAKIEAIELGEGLPHPMIEGEWGKISKEANRSYLISNFDEESVMTVAQHASWAGFKYIYHMDPWKSWGHFNINLPGGISQLNDISLTLCKEGLKVGAHTLSNFIHGHDSYVSPIPDHRLLTIGGTVLIKDINLEDTDIYVEDNTYLMTDMSGRNLKECIIGNEIIRYRGIKEIQEGGYILTGCTRGYRGTQKSSYKKGEVIKRYSTHYYDTLFPNMPMQEEMIQHLVQRYNEGNMKQISFDGLEGGRYLGYDDLGCNLIVDEFYNSLEDKDDFINDASIVTPYLWHIHTRMNWGEPWGEGMREAQMTTRYNNQDYHRRNLLPPMLGWFILGEKTPLIDIEWMLSKAAGFNAGFGLYTQPEHLSKHGLSEEVCKKISQWEAARLQGAFTEDQKKRLQIKGNEWHLEEIETGKRWTIQKVDYPTKPLIKKFNEFQPGSQGVDWPYTNNLKEQPFHFELQVLDGGKIVNPGFLLAKGSIAFQTVIENNQYLVYEGRDTAIKYDENWNEVEVVEAMANGKVIFTEGDQLISLSADEWINPEGLAEVRLITMGEPEDVFVGNETKKPYFTIQAPMEWELNTDIHMSLELVDLPAAPLAVEFELEYDDHEVNIESILPIDEEICLTRYRLEKNKVKVAIGFLDIEKALDPRPLLDLKLKSSKPKRNVGFGISKGRLVMEGLKEETIDLCKRVYDVGITLYYKVQERLSQVKEILNTAEEGREIGNYVVGTLKPIKKEVNKIHQRIASWDINDQNNLQLTNYFYELGDLLKYLNEGLINKESGDLNKDGKVSLEDLVLAMKHYDQPLDKGTVLSRGDIYRDGKIGLDDLEFIADQILNNL